MNNNSVVKTQKFNLEFAHIYTDEKISPNHLASADMVMEITSASPDINYVSSILIDNYNAHDDGFDIQKYLGKLEDHGVKPDFYALESDLIPAAEDLLASITKPKILRMHRSYIERKGKYPCSLLTAAWYLIRLGAIDHTGIIKVNNTSLKPSDIKSDRLINVLPTTFQEIEKDAHKLISYTKYAEMRYLIQPVLFDEIVSFRRGFVPERV